MKTCENCTWWRPNGKLHDPEDVLKLCHRHDRITDDLDTCSFHLGSDAHEINVPLHTDKGIEMPTYPDPVNGPTHILIVTYSKDLPWLVLAMQCLTRFATGFSGVTVACPRHEEELFRRELSPFKARVHPYVEHNGRGMIQHMAVMAEPEKIVPVDTKFVLHMDADCMVHMPIEPGHYIRRHRPDYLVRSYASLAQEDPRNPTKVVVSDCAQWHEPTESQLGMKVEIYTMCRHPTVFPIDFYRRYREQISKVHGKPFLQYMIEGRNQFPQDRMDFTAMGAYAFDQMHDRFHWIDIMTSHYPKDRMTAFHSHKGITAEAKAKIEGFLA